MDALRNSKKISLLAVAILFLYILFTLILDAPRTRVVQEGGRRCKKSTLNDLVHLTPLRIPFKGQYREMVFCLQNW